MNTYSGWRLSVQGWFGLLFLGLALWLAITYAGLLLEILLIVFAAVLLSMAIRPLAERLAHRGIPRGATVIGLYVALVGILALLGSFLAPAIRNEAAYLRTNGSTLVQTSLARLSATPLLNNLLPMGGGSAALSQGMVQRLDTLFGTVLGAAASLGDLAVNLLSILILAYFFATDHGLIERLVTTWVPVPYQPHTHAAIDRLHQRLARWVWAQIVTIIYFAFCFSVGLALLKVPFALSLGMIGGILGIVPVIGGAIALVPAALSALTVNPLLVLWVALLYTVVIEVEVHLLAPAFYGRVIGLHPAIILVALLMGFKVGGVIGLLFAVPVTVVVMVSLQEAQTTLQSYEAKHSSPGATEEKGAGGERQ